MKERKKRSVIWNSMTDDEFREMVKNSKTYVEMLKNFNIVNKGNNHKTLKHRIAKLNIDDSHISKGAGCNLGKKFYKKKIPLEEVLVENSAYSRRSLKQRIITGKILKNECTLCGIKPSWNNKPLVLVLDHVNGAFNDNRLENLRFICPNCHSQTPTFAGKKNKKKRLCPNCGKEKLNRSRLCSICNKNRDRSADILITRKCVRPTKEALEELIKNKPMTSIGKQYGVSGAAVKKWSIRYGIFQYSKFKHRKNLTVPVVGVEPTCTN